MVVLTKVQLGSRRAGKVSGGVMDLPKILTRDQCQHLLHVSPQVLLLKEVWLSRKMKIL